MFQPRYQICYLYHNYLLCVLSLPHMLPPLCTRESDIYLTISISVQNSEPASCHNRAQQSDSVRKIAPIASTAVSTVRSGPYRTALTQLVLKGQIPAAGHVTLTVQHRLQLYHEMSAAINIPFSSQKCGPSGMKDLLCKLPQRAEAAMQGLRS